MAFSFTLCADDYGMSEGVSRGILEAAEAGRISAASAMTSLPDWPRAAKAWVAATPHADLGLHLNLTLGAPLGPMLRFAAAGAFPTVRALIRTAGLPVEEIAAEIGRQIDAFTAHVGRAPDHVDGHQHVHVLSDVREALFRTLAERGMAGMKLRNSADAVSRILRRRTSMAKALMTTGLARGFDTSARAAGHSCNDGFAGFSAFDPAADMHRHFARTLVAPGQNHLVMCHPGRVDAALRALDPVTDAREAELRFLLSDAWPDLLRRRGAILRRDAGS